MKILFFTTAVFLSCCAYSQFYYKDMVGTKESSDLIAVYRKANVQTVIAKSYTVDNTPLENLSVQQAFSPAAQTLRTITRTGYLPASYLTSFFDEANRVVKTTDSTAGGFVNMTVYAYNDKGQLIGIRTTFGDPLASLASDEHQWQWNAQGHPQRMLRIRNGNDTSVVALKHDENGNVIEEQETVRFVKQEPVYYYYDSKNRLTDIVRYNKKAARLLPEQMFEYTSRNELVQRTTVPQNSDNYLVWRYRFDGKGLKTAEEIFNKQKELTGKVEYIYTFGQ